MCTRQVRHDRGTAHNKETRQAGRPGGTWRLKKMVTRNHRRPHHAFLLARLSALHSAAQVARGSRRPGAGACPLQSFLQVVQRPASDAAGLPLLMACAAEVSRGSGCQSSIAHLWHIPSAGTQLSTACTAVDMACQRTACRPPPGI